MSNSSSPETSHEDSQEFKPSVPSNLKELSPPRTATVTDQEVTKLSTDQQVEARMRLAKAHMDDEIGSQETKSRKKIFERKRPEVGVGDRMGYKQPEHKPKSRLGGVISGAIDWLFGPGNR